MLLTQRHGRIDYAGCDGVFAVQTHLYVRPCQLDLGMTREQYKQWLLERLAEVEAKIDQEEARPATAHEANIVFEAKKHAYKLQLFELANLMPERELKTPLDCCLRLRECLDYLETPPPAACDDNSLLDAKEAARILSLSVDRTRRLANKGEIRHVRFGGRRGQFKFRREWLEEYIAGSLTGPKKINRSPSQRRAMPIVFEPRESFDPSFFQSNS